MIPIPQPAMTLNAVACPPIARYQMWNTWDIESSVSRQHIVEWVARVARSAPGGRLKNLIIQCHGSPGHIGIGQGFGRSHTRMFEAWRTETGTLIEKIWIVACEPARISNSCTPGTFCAQDGNLFISEIARAARSFVVAPTEVQTNLGMTYPFGVLPSYEGLLLSYNPAGATDWNHRYDSHWTANRE